MIYASCKIKDSWKLGDRHKNWSNSGEKEYVTLWERETRYIDRDMGRFNKLMEDMLVSVKQNNGFGSSSNITGFWFLWWSLQNKTINPLPWQVFFYPLFKLMVQPAYLCNILDAPWFYPHFVDTVIVLFRYWPLWIFPT